MEDQQSLFEFNVDEASANEIVEMTRWTKLFAILLGCVLVVVLMIFIIASGKLTSELTEQMGDEKSIFIGFLYVMIILVLAVAGIMLFFLLRASNRIRNGLYRHDQLLFNSGLNDLKIYFIFVGVISILSLCSSLLTSF